MDKKTRNLLLTIVSFIVIIVVATILYNQLVKSAPTVSMVPTLAEYTPPAKGEAMKAQPAPDQEEVAEVDRDEAVGAEDGQELGPVMPDIPLFTLDDEETSFDEVRAGRPAIINFFASWCPPCKAELPHFEKAWQQYGDEIAFIFLDSIDGQRETKETINKFIAQFPFKGPVYWDEGIFAYIFQTNSLPTTVFFDKDGRVVTGFLGMVSEEALHASIAQILK